MELEKYHDGPSRGIDTNVQAQDPGPPHTDLRQ